MRETSALTIYVFRVQQNNRNGKGKVFHAPARSDNAEYVRLVGKRRAVGDIC